MSSASFISSIPLWGRAWELVVYAANGDQYTLSQNSWEPEALRITFEVLESVLPSPYWFADIAVYNLNAPTAQNILLNAQWVTLSAGFQIGPSKSSIIWSGPVLQTTFDKENVVDQVIRFNCVAIGGRTPTGEFLQENTINTAYGILSSQLTVVSNFIALANSGNPNPGPLSSNQSTGQIGPMAEGRLGAKQYPRGKTFFGKPSKYIAQLSEDNNANFWKDAQGKYNISELYDPTNPPTPAIIYSPPFPPDYNQGTPNASTTYSIISVPKQTLFGCIFQVLLDPRLVIKVPPMVVKLDETLIQQLLLQIGQLPAAKSILTQSGIYIVGQVRHVGDSRRNTWMTEVLGYSVGWAQNLFNGSTQAAAAGSQ
jgi:hypothetical protein